MPKEQRSFLEPIDDYWAIDYTLSLAHRMSSQLDGWSNKVSNTISISVKLAKWHDYHDQSG